MNTDTEYFSFDPSTLELTIEGVRFDIPAVSRFLDRLKTGPFGPYFLRVVDDRLVVTAPPHSLRGDQTQQPQAEVSEALSDAICEAIREDAGGVLTALQATGAALKEANTRIVELEAAKDLNGGTVVFPTIMSSATIVVTYRWRPDGETQFVTKTTVLENGPGSAHSLEVTFTPKGDRDADAAD